MARLVDLDPYFFFPECVKSAWLSNVKLADHVSLTHHDALLACVGIFGVF